MKKILLIGSDSCSNKNLKLLFTLAGFDLLFTANLEEAINLIEIKKSFSLLIIPRHELINAAPAFFNFLNHKARQINILVFGSTDQNLQGEIGFDEFFESEGTSFCESGNIVGEAKRLLGRS